MSKDYNVEYPKIIDEMMEELPFLPEEVKKIVIHSFACNILIGLI